MTPRPVTLVVLCCVLCACVLCAPGMHAQPAPKVLYLGDSITEGWMDGVLQPSLAYPAVADSMLRTTGPVITVNCSRSGETTLDALQRLERDVRSLRPDLVVVAYGSNDYYIHGYATEPRMPVDATARNLVLIGRALRDAGIRSIFLGLPPLVEDRFAQYSPARLYVPFGGALALNRRYARAAAAALRASGETVVDNPIDSSVGLDALLGIDGVHPTPEGHALIASVLVPVIRLRLADPPPAMSAARDVEVFPRRVVRGAGSTVILSCPTRGSADIRLSVFDMRGREAAAFTAAVFHNGIHYLSWDLTATDGTPVAAGPYVIVLRTPEYSAACSILVF